MTETKHIYAQQIKIATRYIELPKGSFLAGGALNSAFTSQPIKDYDFYFKNEDALKYAIEFAYENGFWCVSCTDRAITFSDNGTIYQFMTFSYFDTAQSIFDRFDFTCVMAALDADTGELVLHERFLVDTCARQLVFNHKTDYPLASAIRLLKYQKKGFTISKNELLKMVMAVNQKPVNDWGSAINQIGGFYGECLQINKDSEFNLDNAIEAIGSATIDNPIPEKSNQPNDYAAAISMIFGDKK